jgi:hypothetical protein
VREVPEQPAKVRRRPPELDVLAVPVAGLDVRQVGGDIEFDDAVVGQGDDEPVGAPGLRPSGTKPIVLTTSQSGSSTAAGLDPFT